MNRGSYKYFGIFGTIIGLIGFLPVIYNVYNTHQTNNFPYKALILFILSQILWVLHGSYTKDSIIVLSGLLYFILYNI